MINNVNIEFEPAPCDDCKSYHHCAENETACSDFVHYIKTGEILEKNRTTYENIYRRIFRIENGRP